MIGDGWGGEPAIRPDSTPAGDAPPRRIAIVTGSRADFGLLVPVIDACRARADLETLIVACGSHLVGPALTYREVAQRYEVAERVPMQVAGRTGREADVEALGQGVLRLGRAFARLDPGWVVVLGDRIEAMAAAVAASVGGWGLAHIHGGDRAEGVADEAMRHAITKLAHLHLVASDESGERVRRMGERPEALHVVGSPALDGLDAIEPMPDEEFQQLGSPSVLVLMHPVGRTSEGEEAAMARVLEACEGERVLALAPNLDPGRVGIVRALASWGGRVIEHLPRERFVALLRRLADAGGVLVGNSSCALIEASYLRLACVDIGPRQRGRQTAGNVIHVDGDDPQAIRRAIERARSLDMARVRAIYGDGRAGERIASILARLDAHTDGLVRKLNVY